MFLKLYAKFCSLGSKYNIRISVFDGDSFLAIKVRHTNTPFNADVHLVHVSRCHYIALGMCEFIYLFIYFIHNCILSCIQKLYAMKMHSNASSLISATSRSIPDASSLISCKWPFYIYFSGRI